MARRVLCSRVEESVMRVGIPTWNGRISPLLDTAERLVVVDTGRESGDRAEDVALGAGSLWGRAASISELGLDVLICGAVSGRLAEMLSGGGLTVVPWRSGDVEEVLRAFAEGRLDEPQFLMPGCCGRRGGRRRQRRRGRAGSAGAGRRRS